MVAYLVVQRAQEVGVRIALGAQQYHVLGIVLREGVTIVTLASCIGVLAALGLSRVLANFLCEVNPRDVLTFVAAPMLLAAVAMLATDIPARRAPPIDPMLSLRRE